jgi:hypothetical protein
MGLAALLGVLVLSAAARAEVVAPDDPEPAPKHDGDAATSNVVDEPGFKVKLAIPEKSAQAAPATKPKSALVVPQEEGLTEDGQAADAGPKEELSDALAKAIGREKSGKPARDMVKE